MSWYKIGTIIVIAVGVLLWIGWDIVVATNKEKGDTISEIIRFVSRHSLLVPAMLGILLGHWMIPASAYNMKWWVTLIILSILGLSYLGIDIYTYLKGFELNKESGLVNYYLRKYPIIMLQIHVIVGFLVWTWVDK